jgi:hypothetical protein
MSAQWTSSSAQKSTFKLPAYSWRLNPHQKDIEHGDKIILHANILNALMQRFGEKPMPYPMLFEIQNIKDRRISHVGVMEFSAEQSAAFLPLWVMANLDLKDGQEVQIRLRELQLATSLVLQPLKWDFGEIATPKLALEHALRSFTALTVGDTINIRVGTQTHSLIVQDIKPDGKRAAGQPNAACVVDAQIAVDFLPPLEAEPESQKPLELTLGVPMAGEAASGSYKYFRCKTLDSGLAVQIEVAGRKGDPEIVVSTQTNKPQMTECTWKSIGASSSSAPTGLPNGVKRVVVNPTSLGFVTGWYYVGVFAYKEDAEFDIVVREAAPVTVDKGPQGSTVGSIASTDPNAKQCDTCHQWIGAKAFSLHTAQCARMNVFCHRCDKPIRKSEQAAHAHCEICNALMHPDAISKHVDLVHKSVACPDCSEPVEPSQMVLHKSSLCSMRPAHCKYCSMELAHRLLAEHESHCGAVTEACERCKKPVPRRKMDIHLAVEHGINSSLKPGDRSSMGSVQPALTAAQFGAQQREAAGFQTKEDPTKPRPPPPPMTEDEALARAIAESMGETLPEYGQEAAASAFDAFGAPSAAAVATASSSSSSTAAPVSSSSTPAVAPLARARSMSDEEDDFGADDADGEEEVVKWESDEESNATAATSNGKGGDERCPYCSKGFETFAALEKHMASCTEMDA